MGNLNDIFSTHVAFSISTPEGAHQIPHSLGGANTTRPTSRHFSSSHLRRSWYAFLCRNSFTLPVPEKSLEPGSCVTNLPYWVSQCTCISVLLPTEMRGLLVTPCRMAFPWIIHLAPARFVPEYHIFQVLWMSIVEARSASATSEIRDKAPDQVPKSLSGSHLRYSKL